MKSAPDAKFASGALFVCGRRLYAEYCSASLIAGIKIRDKTNFRRLVDKNAVRDLESWHKKSDRQQRRCGTGFPCGELRRGAFIFAFFMRRTQQ